MKLLLFEFEHTMSPEELSKHSRMAADAIAGVAGLVWKVWFSSRDQKRAGGVYLFESEPALVRYLDGPIVAKLLAQPAFLKHRFQVFDLMEEAGRLTRAPLPGRARAGWAPEI